MQSSGSDKPDLTKTTWHVFRSKGIFWNDDELAALVILAVQERKIFSDENIMPTAEIVSYCLKDFKRIHELWELDKAADKAYKDDHENVKKKPDYMQEKAQRLNEMISLIFKHFRISPHFHFSNSVIALAHNYLPAMKDALMEHKLETTWRLLKRLSSEYTAITENGTKYFDSKIGITVPHIVPGGRFLEFYYWDSFFTSLGLVLSKDPKTKQLAGDMLEAFLQVQDDAGKITNGTRCFFLSRSQPPMLSFLMELVEKESNTKDVAKLVSWLKHAIDEWEYFNNKDEHRYLKIDVKLDGKNVVGRLNNYYDERDVPRGEAASSDMETAEQLLKYNKENKIETPKEIAESNLYRNIRAGAESGLDFSPKWMEFEKYQLMHIETTSILAVELNSYLYHLEAYIVHLAKKIAELAPQKQEESKKVIEDYTEHAAVRKHLIKTYMWDAKAGCFFDVQKEVLQGTIKGDAKLRRDWIYCPTAAAPIFSGVLDLTKEAERMMALRTMCTLNDKLLEAGGYATIQDLRFDNKDSFQWDYPNGWAPLQWLAVQSALMIMEHYKDTIPTDTEELKKFLSVKENCKKAMRGWIDTLWVYFAANKQQFPEKLCVVPGENISLGEYPMQEGFGWTNGVSLKFINLLKQLEAPAPQPQPQVAPVLVPKTTTEETHPVQEEIVNN